ncbi:hypothetical protein Tco_1446896 [Tanacetum coccineum]
MIQTASHLSPDVARDIQKASLEPVDEDEVISKDATSELLDELKSFDKRVPIIADHKRMEATLKNMMSNQLKSVEESCVIWERVHGYQLGIESYQIKVNVTSPTLTIPSIKKLNPYSIVDKVLKEVSLKIVESRYKLKTPLIGDLDQKIMEAFEREIKKRLRHQRQMRRWEAFVNGRPILQSRVHHE